MCWPPGEGKEREVVQEDTGQPPNKQLEAAKIVAADKKAFVLKVLN